MCGNGSKHMEEGLKFVYIDHESSRSTYLYFIFNVLIIALGAEPGLLSIVSKPLEDRKQHVSVTQKLVMPPEVYEPDEERVEGFFITGGSGAPDHSEGKAKVIEMFASDEKIAGVTEVDEEIEAGEGGGVNGQELFAKAEAFIGNFYRQLKMQREAYQETF
ncbi:unnamed protein product [Sphenostylis stenocarpa]|uniref:Uncharacterized protein n=1 Tax=Sphenostylis stenocarpa TaxID=92480 RepID=A0AA86VS23_9FABA|nr:unnamed protein product [Sphenostylis stenocarpa]